MPQFLNREIDDACCALVVLKTGDIFEPCVIGGGVAVVVQLHTVHTHHVHSHGIAVVFCRPRGQEYIPILDADSRPTSHTDQDIIHIRLVLPQPNGETQVITNRQTNLHTSVLKDRTLCTGCKEIRLSAGAVEMMFVVILRCIVRSEDESAVIQFAMVGSHHRADDRHLMGIRHVLKRQRTLAGKPFIRQTGTVGAKTGGEHLRHNRYIRLSGYSPQAFVQKT